MSVHQEIPMLIFWYMSVLYLKLQLTRTLRVGVHKGLIQKRTISIQVSIALQVSVTDGNVEEVAYEVALISAQTDDLTANDVENIVVCLDSIVSTNSSSPKVSTSMRFSQMKVWVIKNLK